MRTASLMARKVSCVRRTSPGLSSTRRMSMGVPFSPISFMSLSRCRQGEAKRRAMACLRLHRDGAAIPLDDLLADGEAYAGAAELLAPVQPLEHAEDLLEILRLDAEPVVTHREQPPLVGAFGGRDVN